MRFLGTTSLCSLLWYTLIGLFQSRAALEAEILVLRHQLNVLRRSCPKRVEANNVKRVLADIDADNGDCGFERVGHSVLLIFGACVCRKPRPLDLMRESLQIGCDGRADLPVLEPGCLVLQAQVAT